MKNNSDDNKDFFTMTLGIIIGFLIGIAFVFVI